VRSRGRAQIGGVCSLCIFSEKISKGGVKKEDDEGRSSIRLLIAERKVRGGKGVSAKPIPIRKWGDSELGKKGKTASGTWCLKKSWREKKKAWVSNEWGDHGGPLRVSPKNKEELFDRGFSDGEN